MVDGNGDQSTDGITDQKKPHPNSLANLRPPWQPGQSGNPGGRPVRKPITDQLWQLIDEAIEEGKLKGKIKSRAAAEAIFLYAMKGSAPHIKMLIELLEGKTPQHIDVGVSGELTHKVEDLSTSEEDVEEMTSALKRSGILDTVSKSGNGQT